MAGLAEKQMAMELEPMKEWGVLYWSYNVPLQLWEHDGGRCRVLNYMPRKECCEYLSEPVEVADLPAYCRNAARILRNLASLFDAKADGKIGTIYYPDEPVEDAIQKAVEERAEAVATVPGDAGPAEVTP